MLQVMKQAAQNPAQPDSASFAGILAALSAPAHKSAPAWNDDALEEDVATLSYENALRTHARYPRSDADGHMLKRAVDPGSIRIREASPAGGDAAGQTERLKAATGPKTGAEAVAPQVAPQALDVNLKRASITVRLSDAECAQLRMRANDAGLTVSGYLRSCTFEAETLRAQVKQALAELRTDRSKESEIRPARVERSWFQLSWPRWFLRPFASWHGVERIARV
jgi:hypothetical protein